MPDMKNNSKVLSAQEIRQKAIGMLARRALTRKELRDRLRKKGGILSEIDAVVQEFTDKGYINEQEIIEDHIHRGLESRYSGKLLLFLELTRRGLAKDVVEAVLSREYDSVAEAKTARAFAEKKLPSYDALPSEKRYRRLSSALHRRGFPSEIIRSVLRDLNVEPFEG